MSIENEKTIEVYKKTASIYLANSIEHDKLDPVRADEKRKDLNDFIKKSLSNIPLGSDVLEIGSGDGANAKYIESLGYKVTASDIAPDFIESSRNLGLNTIKFNALKDDFDKTYFAIFCWRVFVHFTKEDALEIIRRVYNNLKENGIFIFNAINRETKEVDNEWIDFPGEYHMGAERYYSYYKKEELDEIISQTDFNVQSFHQEGGKSNNKWLVYVLKK